MKGFNRLTAALVGLTAAGTIHARPLTTEENIAAPATMTKRTNCPADLQANFEFPHLIVPISAAQPDTAFANTFFPEITPNDVCTIFNFDLPPSAEGKICNLEFYFPEQSDLQTSSYTFSGPGNFVFSGYNPGSGAVAGVTTYNNQPTTGPFPPFPPLNLQPGSYHSIDKQPCYVPVSGQSTLISGKICSNDTYFSYFQDSNPCPIGVYVGITDS